MPSFRRFCHSALVLAAAASMLACRDGVGPGDVAGTYNLESVNGAPVPLPGVNEHVSGTIELSAIWRVDWRVAFRADESGRIEERRWAGTFTLRGHDLQLNVTEVDPRALTVVYVPPTFELRDGAITFRYQKFGAMSVTNMVEIYRKQ